MKEQHLPVIPWKKLRNLMFSEDRRPLLNIRDQMKKVSKIEKKEFLKEFKDKMKRLKVTRHKQLIHLAGGKQ